MHASYKMTNQLSLLLQKADAESRYTNIETELLTIVFTCQRFSTCLLDRSFIAESNHKSLEMIAIKNLASAFPHLQRVLLQLQHFDVTIKYRPGAQMHHLHKGHLSVKKVQENANEHLYWSGIDADIVRFTKRCQESIAQSRSPKEPLQLHDIPEGPWRNWAWTTSISVVYLMC